jgi:hypothetical protein
MCTQRIIFELICKHTKRLSLNLSRLLRHIASRWSGASDQGQILPNRWPLNAHNTMDPKVSANSAKTAFLNEKSPEGGSRTETAVFPGGPTSVADSQRTAMPSDRRASRIVHQRPRERFNPAQSGKETT